MTWGKGIAILALAAYSVIANAYDADAIAALNDKLSEQMKTHHAPALSYAFFDENGVTHAQALGFSDNEQKKPANTATLFRVGSITKTLTAVAIMQLVEQGKIKLDDRVKALLPDAPIRNKFEATDPVLVIHLLEHTAGFDDMRFKGMYRDGEVLNAHMTAFAVDPDPLTTRWHPGTIHSYSNPGYGLLGAIIENVTGQGWEDYIRAHVLLPLGMDQSVLTIAEAKERDFALPYTGEALPAKLPALYLRSAGVLWSTPTDLSKFMRFIMTDGLSAPGVLQPDSIITMKTVHSTLAAKQGLEFGYAIGLLHSVHDKRIYLGHDGGIDGFIASMAYDIESGVGYVEVHNTDNAGRAFRAPITAFIAEQHPLPETPLASVKPADDLTGWFRLSNTRNELMRLPEWLFAVGSMSVKDKELMLSPLVNANVTFSVNEQEWLSEKDSGQWTGMIFRDTHSGEITGFTIDGQHFERINALQALVPFLGFFAALVFLLTVPFGRRKALKNPWVRRMPTLALLSFAGFVGCLFLLSLAIAATMNAVTIAILLFSILFPVFALLSVLVTMYAWPSETAVLAKWRSAMGAVSAFYIAFLFYKFHLTGLALWAW